MENMNIQKISCVNSTKFLNTYIIDYELNGKLLSWTFVSREKDLDKLSGEEFLNRKIKCSAVRMLPWFYDGVNKDFKVCIIKEFRMPLGKTCISLPAGLIDDNESYIDAVKRETMEEIGANVIGIEEIASISATSPGLTDETIICFNIKIEKPVQSKQNLSEQEIIKSEIISVQSIPTLLNNKDYILDSQSAIMLRHFYNDLKNKNLLIEKNDEIVKLNDEIKILKNQIENLKNIIETLISNEEDNDLKNKY